MKCSIGKKNFGRRKYKSTAVAFYYQCISSVKVPQPYLSELQGTFITNLKKQIIPYVFDKRRIVRCIKL